MNSSGTRPIFTLGLSSEEFQLPHPSVPLPVILVIHRVFLEAFALLREQGSLASLSEDEITAALRAVVENDLRQRGRVPGFNRQTFETVTRQAQVANFDLSRLAKEPDLCFRLLNYEDAPRAVIAEHDGLFAECKPVDRKHAVGPHYCDKGLSRFVEGDYAWAMQEGMMVGYSREGRTIAGNLIPAMNGPERQESLKILELPRPAMVSQSAKDEPEPLHVSRHRRGFTWVAGKGTATDITIYHSWHCCD